MFDFPLLAGLANIFGTRLSDIRRVLEYLIHYGYIDATAFDRADNIIKRIEAIRAALRAFHAIAGMKEEGEVSVQTLAKMTEPRCGCSDALRAVEFARWRKNRLNYFVAAYVNGLSRADQDDLLRLAWNDWQGAGDIVLTPVSSQQQADIVIATGRGQAQGFDGGGGTLAWAYLPNGSDQQLLMRFDIDERWMRDNPQGGILFRNVACHEFGHLLGLEHSRVSSALMAPFYSPSVVSPQANDDISRIQNLYGKPQGNNPPPPPPAGKVTVTLEVQGKTAKVVSVV